MSQHFLVQVCCDIFYCTNLEIKTPFVEFSTGLIVKRNRLVELDRDVVLDRRDVELDRDVVLVRDVEVKVDPFVDVSAVDVSAVDVSAVVVSSDVSSYNLK